MHTLKFEKGLPNIQNREGKKYVQIKISLCFNRVT
ncbi:hypothetical protein Desor_5500 [Desulfosporosinus orientis DSM 765]|uniref:Uncharacterized protein n=1 Tax=Desulfosporosinus orientis (strain ATCC 19365 / DSM 765 / NCIMB 8382 / VKM B-1628 / Singapore I) TaxID=768706 RepID=G7WGE2_DESOD|nr:hypothetical protein Desor_5500 [Desulfosporosinus orientis DSM 765]